MLKIIDAQSERWYDQLSLIDDDYNGTPMSVTEYWRGELEKMYIKERERH